MLLAALALLVHGASTVAQHAAAAVGFFPVPSEPTVGSFHTHGQVSHAHTDTSVGHVHHPNDHHDPDEHSDLIWSVGWAPGIMPTLAFAALSLAIVSKVEGGCLQRLSGIDPPQLSRPPSTPSIA
jgi:hypothetical protein